MCSRRRCFHDLSPACGEYINEQGERYGEIVVGCQVVSVGGVGCLVVVVVVVLIGWGVA